MDPGGQHSSEAAQRRKQRRLRSWWRHEQQSTAAALATSLHHSAPRGQKKARAGEGDLEMHCTATFRTHPPPRRQAPCTIQRMMCLPLVAPGLRPQERVLRRTVEQNVDAVTFPTLDVPVPHMVDQPVDILKIIAKLSPAVEEQVMDVPKTIQDPTPQRLELSEPQQLVEQLVEVPLPNPVLLAHWP